MFYFAAARLSPLDVVTKVIGAGGHSQLAAGGQQTNLISPRSNGGVASLAMGVAQVLKRLYQFNVVGYKV